MGHSTCPDRGGAGVNYRVGQQSVTVASDGHREVLGLDVGDSEE